MANPFEDDMDTVAPSRRAGGAGGYKPITRKQQATNANDEWAQYEAQIEKSMQSTLDSTKRSMMMLEESEQAGVKTAEELERQGEQLRNVDRNLDEINASTAQAQRNLNNIKSVFGGVKNYFSKKPPPAPSSGTPTTGVSKKQQEKDTADKDKLKNQIANFKNDSLHPSHSAPTTGGHSLNEESRQAIKGTRWEAMDNEVDDNLDLMSANLRRLRGLGVALGEEADRQNELLDRINTKTEKTDTVIRHQDNQMKKILGVKDPLPTIKKPGDKPDATGPPATSASDNKGGWSSGTGSSARKWFS